MSLKIYNTLTRTKQVFEPRHEGRVDMFVCGPTVYDLGHVGHAKTYTQFDLIARYLRRLGYDVTYLQNITDVDDKIITRAAQNQEPPAELAARYESLFMDDMAGLHNTGVSRFARAHDYIDAIVGQVQQLIATGHAYELDDGWYFDLASFPDYGKLSGRTEIEAEDSVARIDEHRHKRNPGDFALWKARKPGEPYWDTPLGQGRPGWHIEDTAITESEFGPQYDLHGGAVDLIFPHHEAEVAQMEAASGQAPLARYWMHTGLLRVSGTKMSKSLGNFLTIRDALQLADFRTLRFAFLSQHYRSSMELTDSTLELARNTRRRVENFARAIDPDREDGPEVCESVDRFVVDFYAHLDDDFDTPGALATLFDFIRDRNRAGDSLGGHVWQAVTDINDLFDAFDLEDRADDDEIEALVAQRTTLRAERRFGEADAVRATLLARGVIIEDTPAGTRWWYDSNTPATP